jgi:hypothetical protein
MTPDSANGTVPSASLAGPSFSGAITRLPSPGAAAPDPLPSLPASLIASSC